MEYRILGRTGLRVSALAFGAGPVSGLMTDSDESEQLCTLQRAVDLGINWIDTAAGYGQGASEQNLGRLLQMIRALRPFQIATKVRLTRVQLDDISGNIVRSVEQSLARLRITTLTLLQLHNGITAQREDEPDSIAVDDVLGANGVSAVFDKLRQQGLVQAVGLTGTGQVKALKQVVHSGVFDTLQVPYHRLNPSAGSPNYQVIEDTHYGNIIADCAELNMGVFAVRVFAGGALLGNPPSAHTLKTRYFPLAQFNRDCERAKTLPLEPGSNPTRDAIRFVLSHPSIHSAIIGFGSPEHVSVAVQSLEEKDC